MLDTVNRNMQLSRVTDATVPSARALAIGERHLAMLAELAEVAMEVSRAYGASAIASAQATDMILKDDYFVPEVGRARACGAKDAAESFQKVTRAVRLTLMMERQTLEWMEGRRSATPMSRPPDLDRRRPANASDRDTATDAKVAYRDDERERLEARDRQEKLDPPDALFHAAFRETVDAVCDDLGVAADWTAWKVARPCGSGAPRGGDNIAPRPPPPP